VRSLRAQIPLIGSALLVVALDLATKLAVYHTMTLGARPRRILGDFALLNYVQNPGAAFSLFRGSRWFFILVASLSILVVLYLALGGRHNEKRTQAAFGLILGGALGNLIDRIWLGVVIDFLDVGIGTHRWPVFNVADAGVTAGVILLGLCLLLEKKETHPGEQEVEEADGRGSAG
jgi:signal peptidase II